MKLTKHTDYGLRVLMYLALKPEETHTIPEISKRFDISRNHLMKVVNRLANEGYIVSRRGRGGGLQLAKPSKSIRIGDVVQSMEPSLQLADCSPEGGCKFIPDCRLRVAFGEATQALIQTLDNYSLYDLVSEPKQLLKLVG